MSQYDKKFDLRIKESHHDLHVTVQWLRHVADFRPQSNNPIIISSSPTGKNMRPADSALEIFRSPDHDLCIPGHRILRPREPWLYLEKYLIYKNHTYILYVNMTWSSTSN